MTKKFPGEELCGVTLQLKRASLSVSLNYAEGYARRKKLVAVNFLEISHGSLQESKRLLEFCRKECFITESDYAVVVNLAQETGAMLWKTMENPRKS